MKPNIDRYMIGLTEMQRGAITPPVFGNMLAVATVEEKSDANYYNTQWFRVGTPVVDAETPESTLHAGSARCRLSGRRNLRRTGSGLFLGVDSAYKIRGSCA